MRLKRLDHFGVDVADLGRAERFYREVLGMSVQMRLADQVVMRGRRDLVRALSQARPRARRSRARGNPLGKSHHAFEVGWEDLKSAEALFAARGVPYHAPIDWGDHDCLYFLDPDGNLLELVGYRPKGERRDARGRANRMGRAPAAAARGRAAAHRPRPVRRRPRRGRPPAPGAARSPHAHARVRSLDAAPRRRAPGVVAVVTAADLEAIGPLPVCGSSAA